MIVMENGLAIGGLGGGGAGGSRGARRGEAPTGPAAPAGEAGRAPGRSGRGGFGGGFGGGFERVLIDDLIPHIDAHFRTIADQPPSRHGRSLHGRHADPQITLANLDTFSHIGIFSGGSLSMEDVNNAPGFKEKVKLVFVGYGSRELGATAAADEGRADRRCGARRTRTGGGSGR